VFLFLSFAGYVFFGEQIAAISDSIPIIYNFKEYMGLTSDNMESFIIFMLIIMVPLTVVTVKASKGLTSAPKRSSRSKIITIPIPTHMSSKIPSDKKLKIKKPDRKKTKIKEKFSFSKIKFFKISLPKLKKTEKRVKVAVTPKTEVVKTKVVEKTVGLTGLHIK
jgi:hypothetical protein